MAETSVTSFHPLTCLIVALNDCWMFELNGLLYHSQSSSGCFAGLRALQRMALRLSLVSIILDTSCCFSCSNQLSLHPPAQSSTHEWSPFLPQTTGFLRCAWMTWISRKLDTIPGCHMASPKQPMRVFACSAITSISLACGLSLGLQGLTSRTLSHLLCCNFL